MWPAPSNGLQAMSWFGTLIWGFGFLSPTGDLTGDRRKP